MKALKPIDPAEKWIAKQFLEPSEYTIFLRDSLSLRNEIKKRIFSEIRKLLLDSSQTKPPFAPEQLGAYRRVKNIIPDETLSHKEAVLIPEDGGFIIKYNPKKPKVRIRFGIAHEIGHTYFFDLKATHPQKFYSLISSRYWVEEGYACEIAREILVPEPYLSTISTQICDHPSVNALVQLQRTFNVSYEVLLKRLLHDSHLWNSNFWGNNLWNAIIVMANISSKDNNIKNLKVYRSPTYKYKFRDSKKLRDMVIRIIKNRSLTHDNITISKNKYKVEWILLERAEPVIILVITNVKGERRNI